MREWLTVIVILLIVGILLDGWRRMRNARRDSLRVSPKSYRPSVPEPKPAKVEEETFTSELPNGGARVVAYREPPPMPTPTVKARPARTDSDTAKPRIPQQVTLNLDEAVPLLMESIDDEGTHSDYVESAEPRAEYTSAYAADEYEADDGRLEPSFTALDDEDDMEAPEPRRAPPPKKHTVRESKPAPAPAPTEPEEVLIINIMSHEGQRFVGSELLDVVLQCGMRYGSMNIFHRHTDGQGDGVILFSMANMVKPGTFDLDAMDEFTTPGVSLFMTLPLDVDSSLQAFEVMLDTAKRIAEALDGELKDENRSVMTRQTMEHCRERIRDFERKQMSRVPH